jgi:hypothetical protein
MSQTCHITFTNDGVTALLAKLMFHSDPLTNHQPGWAMASGGWQTTIVGYPTKAVPGFMGTDRVSGCAGTRFIGKSGTYNPMLGKLPELP